MSTANPPAPLRLRLPATSANLGPGFDAVGLAMDFYLEVEATVAEAMELRVTGRGAEAIAAERDNLVVATYRGVLQQHGVMPMPLSLVLHNDIPLGMGCGSSAAALVAGVALANHFGNLGWGSREILAEAARREGHPDNVAACVLGGFTASAMRGSEVHAIAIEPAAAWQLLLVLPETSLSTKTARALLPDGYTRADAVANVQNVALLTAAFATGDGGVLQAAMQDRLHQPYREGVCPLLPLLAPLAGSHGVLGVALSGAGPSVLLVVDRGVPRMVVETNVWASCSGKKSRCELLWTTIARLQTAVIQTVT